MVSPVLTGSGVCAATAQPNKVLVVSSFFTPITRSLLFPAEGGWIVP
jgi:hypothetical protein